MEDFKKLAKDIFYFIDNYAGICPEYDSEDDKFTSPDATMLYAAGISISDGIAPSFSVNSDWGSGGYKPYPSVKGRKIHDKLIYRISKLPKRFMGSTEFWLGPIVKVHEIGEYQIIEYQPEIFEGCHGTGNYEKEITKFHVWNRNNSFDSLDMALIGAISFKHDGINTRAPQYIELMLGIK